MIKKSYIYLVVIALLFAITTILYLLNKKKYYRNILVDASSNYFKDIYMQYRYKKSWSGEERYRMRQKFESSLLYVSFLDKNKHSICIQIIHDLEKNGFKKLNDQVPFKPDNPLQIDESNGDYYLKRLDDVYEMITIQIESIENNCPLF